MLFRGVVLRSYDYSDPQEKPPFKWHFKLGLLVFIFAVTVLKNSGCATYSTAVDQENKEQAVSLKKDAGNPLIISPRSIELTSQADYTKRFQVTGGKEPYVFFLADRDKYTLDISGSNVAELKFKAGSGIKTKQGTSVYVMDGKGDIAVAEALVVR